MKGLLMVVAFVLGAAITWFLTVKRVSRTVTTVEGGAAPVAPEAEVAPVVSPGGPVAGAVGVAGGADLVAATNPGVLATEGSDAAEGQDSAEAGEASAATQAPEGAKVPDEGSERSAGDGDVDGAEDDASEFGGAHTPTSESPGSAEGWDRDAEDEDALLPRSTDDTSGSDAPPVDARARRDATPDPARQGEEPARQGAARDEAVEELPPVANATPKGDVAGVGDPAEVAAIEESAPDATPKPDRGA